MPNALIRSSLWLHCAVGLEVLAMWADLESESCLLLRVCLHHGSKTTSFTSEATRCTRLHLSALETQVWCTVGRAPPGRAHYLALGWHRRSRSGWVGFLPQSRDQTLCHHGVNAPKRSDLSSRFSVCKTGTRKLTPSSLGGFTSAQQFNDGRKRRGCRKEKA